MSILSKLIVLILFPFHVPLNPPGERLRVSMTRLIRGACVELSVPLSFLHFFISSAEFAVPYLTPHVVLLEVSGLFLSCDLWTYEETKLGIVVSISDAAGGLPSSCPYPSLTLWIQSLTLTSVIRA